MNSKEAEPLSAHDRLILHLSLALEYAYNEEETNGGEMTLKAAQWVTKELWLTGRLIELHLFDKLDLIFDELADLRDELRTIVDAEEYRETLRTNINTIALTITELTR